MHKETFALKVDYFSLFMRSFRLLRTLQPDVHPYLVPEFGPIYIEKESQLPFLVGWIFRVVSSSDTAGEMSSKTLWRDTKGSKILSEACRVIQSFIDKEGDEQVKKVKAASNVFGGLVTEEVTATSVSKDRGNSFIQNSSLRHT
jgi:hypothetical protein